MTYGCFYESRHVVMKVVKNCSYGVVMPLLLKKLET